MSWCSLYFGIKGSEKQGMTKAELMFYVGKKVCVYFKDEDKVCGILGYADEFSEKYDWRKPNYFFIGNISFKVSHIRKIEGR